MALQRGERTLGRKYSQLCRVNDGLNRELEEMKNKLASVQPQIASVKTANSFLLKVLAKERKEGKELRRGQVVKKDKSADQGDREGRGVEEDAKGKLDYFATLPDELVEQVLENLTAADDLYNCCYASITFSRILGPRKPVWMFSNVFPIVMPLLAKLDVLNLRGVCSSWRSDVDAVLEGIPSFERIAYRSNMQLSHGSLSILNVDSYYVSLRNSRELQTFKTEMSSYVGRENPFVGKRVAFGNRGFAHEQEEDNFWNNVVTFLRDFGEFIQDCEIFLVSHIEMIDSLRRHLQLMPNLKRLVVSSNSRTHYTSLHELDQVEGYLERNQFPNLPYLQIVELVGVSSFFDSVICTRYGQQLDRLVIVNEERMNPLALSENTLRNGLLCLTSLAVYLGNQDWIDMSKLLLLRSPLNTVHLSVANAPVKLEEILKVLNYFGETLQHAQITFRGVKDSSEGVLEENYVITCMSLHLPQLETLRLENVVHSLNFLLCLPCVRKLDIYGWERWALEKFVEEKDGELLEIHGHLNSMYQSNLWSLLPALCTFTCRFAPSITSFQDHPALLYKYIREGLIEKEC